MAEWSPKIRKISGHDDRKGLAAVRSLLSEGRFRDAERALVPILDAESRSFGANIAMGRALQGQGRFEESQHYLSRAVEIDPMEGAAHLLSGMSAYMTGDYAFAAKRFTTSIDIDAKSVPAHIGFARLYYKQEDYQRAIAHGDEALRLDPQSTAARLLRARVFSREGRDDAALEELQQLREFDPDNQVALVSTAFIQMKRGNYQDAVAVLTQALHESHGTALVWGLLGRIKLKAGEYPGAEDAFRNAIRVKGRSGVVLDLLLFDSLVPQGKIEAARTLLGRLPRFGATAAAVQKCYGDLFYAESRYDNAAKAYRAAFRQLEGGEEQMGNLDAALVAEQSDANSKRVSEVLGRAISERLEAARQNYLEQDWHALLDKYEHKLADFANAHYQDGVEAQENGTGTHGPTAQR